MRNDNIDNGDITIVTPYSHHSPFMQYEYSIRAKFDNEPSMHFNVQYRRNIANVAEGMDISWTTRNVLMLDMGFFLR